MATKVNPIIEIPLNAPLNLSRNEYDIANWQGFQKRNAPYISNMLSPLYTKEEQGEGGLVDKNGNSYTIQDKGTTCDILKNGLKIHSVKKYKVIQGSYEFPCEIPLWWQQTDYFYALGNKGENIGLYRSVDGENWSEIETFNLPYTQFKGATIHDNLLWVVTSQVIKIYDVQNNYTELSSLAVSEFTDWLGADNYIFRFLDTVQNAPNLRCAFSLIGAGRQNEFVNTEFIFLLHNDFTIKKIKVGIENGADEPIYLTTPSIMGDVIISDDDCLFCDEIKYAIWQEEVPPVPPETDPTYIDHPYIQVAKKYTVDKDTPILENFSFFARRVATTDEKKNTICKRTDFDTVLYQCGKTVSNTPSDNYKVDAGKFRILYDGGYLSSISLHEEQGQGALLLPFASLSDNLLLEPIANGDEILFFDEKNKLKFFRLNYFQVPEMVLLLDGVLIKTQKENYITSDETILTVASDLNLNLIHGKSELQSDVISGVFVYSQNPFYEITGKKNISYQPTPITLSHGVAIDWNLNQCDEVLFFASQSETNKTPYYFITADGSTRYEDARFKNLPYPALDTIIAGVDLQCEDLYQILNFYYFRGGLNVYRSMMFEDVPILAYIPNQAYAPSDTTLASGFILNGFPYIISSGKIYRYSNTLSDTDREYVADCTGMQFIGATSSEAFFFSLTNRKVYIFTGSNSFSEAFQASAIREIKGSDYNQARGLIGFISEDDTYIYDGLQDLWGLTLKNVERLYLSNFGWVVYLANGKRLQVRYFEEVGFEKNKLKLKTMMYGSDTQLRKVTCVYIKLYSERKELGLLKIKTNTLTDTFAQSEWSERIVKAEDWNESGIMYIRYQPPIQECTAIQFEIESDFAISYMGVEQQELGTTQITDNSF